MVLAWHDAQAGNTWLRGGEQRGVEQGGVEQGVAGSGQRRESGSLGAVPEDDLKRMGSFRVRGLWVISEKQEEAGQARNQDNWHGHASVRFTGRVGDSEAERLLTVRWRPSLRVAEPKLIIS